jgi:Protein of unknown function (DUF3179)
MTPDPQRRTRRRLKLVWLLCLAASFLAVAYPIYVIRPFRAQAPLELAVALVVTRFRPAITVLCAGAALAALVWYWRVQKRIVWRLLAVAGTVCVALLAVATRVNIYELMFHHLDHPEFAAADKVKLDNDEKVIVVKIGDAARAYPIRSMSYHHVVNDMVGQTAIVATY